MYRNCFLKEISPPGSTPYKVAAKDEERYKESALQLMKKILSYGVNDKDLLEILPATETEGKRAAWKILAEHTRSELDRTPAPLPPEQFWTEENLGPAPMPDITVPDVPETQPMRAMPAPDPEVAKSNVAAQLGVPVDKLIIPVPKDGNCLYHCFTAWELGPLWMQGRNEEGDTSIREAEKIHNALAEGLKLRLITFLRTVKRDDQASRLELAGPAGYPGADELPFLAECQHCNIVEYDLEHSLQPSFPHPGGGGDEARTIHIGHTVTDRGTGHWVLLRTAKDMERNAKEGDI